jgi:hypothetical protein
MKATTASRAPRGTKTLKQAFFSAADSVPEAQRDGVIKAALAAIRDELKADKEKARASKARAKAKPAKPMPVKLAAKSPKKVTPAPKMKRAKAKPPIDTDSEVEMV